MDFKKGVDGFLRPATRLLANLGVSPDLLTLFGVGLTVTVPWHLSRERLAAAGFWLLFAGAFDSLDGALARNHGKKSRFGAFFDSSMDRVSEAIVFAGFILYYYGKQQPANILLAFAVCILSQMVSYTRARAEGLGLECKVGILPRSGRVVILGLGLFAGKPTETLWLVALLSLVTVGQRIHLVWMEADRKTARR